MDNFTIDSTLLDRLSADTFDPAIFKQTGVFIVRGAIPAAVVQEWQQEWGNFYESRLRDGRDVNRSNPVALNEQLPDRLKHMYREPVFANTLKPLFGEHIALYNHRFVIKDKYSPNSVFLHQDSCYHLGSLNKCSVFTPLSHVDKDNGGMVFHVGSHRLGFLGDAGEINPASFKFKWPKLAPDLNPGDFVIMNSALWHESGPNVSGIDRILADTIMQPADDPTGEELICGDWQTDIFYSHVNCAQYFANSRVLKIIKFQKDLSAAQAQLATARTEG
jgi:ectoine hydroxylase-related dioxygenase (phytanoyl-CoA dioxygenase family)